MYVCICKKLTDSQIRRAVQRGEVSHLRHLRDRYGACTECGKCSREAGKIIKDTLHECAALETGACLSLGTGTPG
jgi:bacterioferritin-associated ferredoxin